MIDFNHLENRFVRLAPTPAAVESGELKRQGVEMMRTAAPKDLPRSVPLYIVDCAEVTGSDSASKAIYGVTSSDYDLLVQPHVDWAGRGLAMLFSSAALIEDNTDPIALRNAFLSLVLHEFAHCLRENYLDAIKVEPPKDADTMAIVRQCAVDTATRTPNDYDRYLYEKFHLRGHDAKWIRTICHLKWRVEARLGLLLPLSGIYHKRFGRHISILAFELRHEVEACRDLPISEILAMPMPAGFAALWEEDVEAFRAEIESKQVSNMPQAETPIAAGAVPVSVCDSAGPLEVVTMSSLATTFAEVFGLRQKRKRTAEEVFAGIGRDLADGKRIRPEVMEQACFDANKEPTDLEAFVKLHIDRREWAKTRQAASGTAARRDQINVTAAEVEAKYEKAYQERESRMWELASQTRDEDSKDRAKADAESKLLQSAPEERKAALREAGQAVGQIQEEIRLSRIRIADLREATANLRPTLQRAAKLYRAGEAGSSQATDGRALTADWQLAQDANMTIESFNGSMARVKASDAEIAKLEGRVAELEAQLPQAEAAVAAAREQMLVP